MRTEFNQDLKVLSSMIDSSAKIGLVNALNLSQDNMCELFREIKCDGLTMVPTHNCFFVLAKTKIKFYDYPNWLDRINISSFATSMSKLRLTLKNELKKDGELFAVCYQEMCPIDATTRRPRLISTTNMPADFECDDSKEVINFEKLDFTLEDKYLAEEDIVRPVSIDFYHHVNNVEYARLMLAVLDEEFFYNNDIVDFEIHYISECRCGQKIQIFSKTEGDKIYFEIRRDGVSVCKALLSFKSKA